MFTIGKIKKLIICFNIYSKIALTDLIALANAYSDSGPCTLPQRVSPTYAFTVFAVGPLRR